jgi:hypothetical protein
MWSTATRSTAVGKRIRLVGFDGPDSAATQALERMLAARATSRLRQMIKLSDEIDLQIVECSCRPGTEGTIACNYKRAFRRGRNVKSPEMSTLNDRWTTAPGHLCRVLDTGRLEGWMRRDSGEQNLFRSRARPDHRHRPRAGEANAEQSIGVFLEEKFGAVYRRGPASLPLPTRLMAGLARSWLDREDLSALAIQNILNAHEHPPVSSEVFF